MAKWTATMLKKSGNDCDEFSRELCKGYMMVGEEVTIQGGLTLDFRAENVFYYVLKAVDHFCYQMVAYKDKKHSKKKDGQPVSSIRYTSKVLVHRFIIGQRGSHKEAVFVVIHAKRPIYYKPNEKQADVWFREFNKVAQYSKEKEQPERAHKNIHPINSRERYTPTADERYLGEYVSMRSLPGPKKSPAVTRPKSTDQQSLGVPPTNPSRVKSDTALGALTRQSENTPKTKPKPSMAKLTPKQGVQKRGNHAQQGTNVPNQKAYTLPRTDSSSNSSLRNQVSPIFPRSTNNALADDEQSLPSMYAPEEIIFDELDENHWGDDDDDDDDKVENKPPGRAPPKVPRKPVKRGRSLRRIREDGKFVWDITHTTSEEENSTSASQAQSKAPYHDLKDTSKTASSSLSNQHAAKITELKNPSIPVPQGTYVQMHVSMTSSTQHRITSGSTLSQMTERVAMRRRSLSDPPDPSSFLRSMNTLKGTSGSSDELSPRQNPIASVVFRRQPERHESLQSFDSEGAAAPIYVLPQAFGNFSDGRSYGRSPLGPSHPGVKLRNPRKDPLPTPIKVNQSEQTTNSMRHSVISSAVCNKLYHTYDEVTTVQNSRQLLELLTHEQKTGRICVQLKKHDANKGLVFVELKSKIWIASWKKDVNGLAKFQQMLHIGDQLVCVDGQEIRGVKHAIELISSSSGDMVKLVINRMPLAQVVFLTKSMTDTWGCEFLKNELVKMYPGPLKESGIAETPYGPTGEETTWVVTECQHQPVPIMTCDKDEIKNHLFMSKTELPLVLHPKDFIDGLVAILKKNQKITRHTSDYQL